MSTRFTQSGSIITFGNNLDAVVHDILPVGTYNLRLDKTSGTYFLEVAPNMTLPKKLYGDCTQTAGRFLSTFQKRKGTTGVLLSGEKGSGKSLVMRKTSLLGIEAGIPTIIISEEFAGAGFSKVMNMFAQPVIFLFDEFEKIYSDQAQESLLTILDGTGSSDRLVILTVNQERYINTHMINRPGRLYYHIKYKGLTEAFIREYCADMLKNQEHVDKIVQLSTLFEEFNFDMLQAVVEELNRYGESVKEVIALLNVKPPTNSYGATYEVTVLNKKLNREITQEELYTKQTNNPLMRGEVAVEYYIAGEDDEDSAETVIQFSVHDKEVTVSKDFKQVVFNNDEHTVTLTRKEYTSPSYRDLF